MAGMRQENRGKMNEKKMTSGAPGLRPGAAGPYPPGGKTLPPAPTYTAAFRNLG